MYLLFGLLDHLHLNKNVELNMFQADKVRKLKSSGVEKSIWQPEVSVLLTLKKKLELAKKNVNQIDEIQIKTVKADATDVKQLEEEVVKQVIILGVYSFFLFYW